MRGKDVSRPFCLIHPTLYIPLSKTASNPLSKCTTCRCSIQLPVIHFVYFLLHLIYHKSTCNITVSYIAVFCAPGGDTAAEIEAREGGERAK